MSLRLATWNMQALFPVRSDGKWVYLDEVIDADIADPDRGQADVGSRYQQVYREGGLGKVADGEPSSLPDRPIRSSRPASSPDVSAVTWISTRRGPDRSLCATCFEKARGCSPLRASMP